MGAFASYELRSLIAFELMISKMYENFMWHIKNGVFFFEVIIIYFHQIGIVLIWSLCRSRKIWSMLFKRWRSPMKTISTMKNEWSNLFVKKPTSVPWDTTNFDLCSLIKNNPCNFLSLRFSQSSSVILLKFRPSVQLRINWPIKFNIKSAFNSEVSHLILGGIVENTLFIRSNGFFKLFIFVFSFRIR